LVFKAPMVEFQGGGGWFSKYPWLNFKVGVVGFQRTHG
jgi:hypothetical protein